MAKPRAIPSATVANIIFFIPNSLGLIPGNQLPVVAQLSLDAGVPSLIVASANNSCMVNSETMKHGCGLSWPDEAVTQKRKPRRGDQGLLVTVTG